MVSQDFVLNPRPLLQLLCSPREIDLRRGQCSCRICARILLIRSAVMVSQQQRDIPLLMANPWWCRSSSSSGTHRHRAAKEVHLATAVFYFSIRDFCVAMPFVADQSSTLLRMRLSLRLPRLQHRRSWSSHHRQCRRLFRRWHHPLPILVKPPVRVY